MSIYKSTRSYKIHTDDKFTVTSIGLLSSIKLIPEEVYGIILDPPEQTLVINGVTIPSKYYNSDGTPNYFDFKFLRSELRKIDPYEEEYESNEYNDLYNLEKVLLTGELDAGDLYKLPEEELNGSIFTPYAIIRFESLENEFVTTLNIEESYYERKN